MATIQKRNRKKGVVWRAQVRIQGRCVTATFDARSEAHVWAEEIERRLRAGIPLPGELPDGDRPLAEAVNEYLRHMERNGTLKPFTLLNYGRSAGRVLAAFPNRTIKTLTRQDVLRYTETRLAKVGSATVLLDLTLIRQVYKYVRLHWDLQVSSPTDDVPRPKPPKHREPLLTPGQIGGLLAACRAAPQPTLYYYVLTLLHTAMRPSEAAALTWPQVRMDDNLIVLSETKTGRTRAIPMTRKVRSVMRLLARKNPGAYVFLPPGVNLRSLPSEYFGRVFSRLARDQGLPGITLYSLRHLSASYLIMRGVDIRTVAEIMGHTNISMTMRYTHLAAAHKLQALDRLDFSADKPRPGGGRGKK